MEFHKGQKVIVSNGQIAKVSKVYWSTETGKQNVLVFFRNGQSKWLWSENMTPDSDLCSREECWNERQFKSLCKSHFDKEILGITFLGISKRELESIIHPYRKTKREVRLDSEREARKAREAMILERLDKMLLGGK